MSLFGIKKPSRRQFRKRVVVEEEGEGGQPVTTNHQTSTQPVEDSDNIRDSRRASKLSFEDDLAGEEGDTMFRLKKTNHSRRMAKMVEREKKRQDRERERAAAMSRKESSDEESEEEGPTFSLAHRLSEGFIPDAATIHAARKKREMARKSGRQGTDFLSLESRGEEKLAKSKSRLVREDENDKSDSDQEPMMRFGQQGQVSTQMRVLTALENVDIEQEDEETRLWEEGQINKGANVSVQPPPQPTSIAPPPIDQSFLYGSATFPGGDPASYPEGIPGSTHNHTQQSFSLPDRLVPITMESLMSQLRGRLTMVQETHTGHTQRLRQVEGDMAVAEEEVRRLQERDTATSYQFYQEMRGYVRDLLSCLAEKAAEVERLEQSLVSVWRERAELLVERRRQDVRDESAECTQGGRADHTSQRRAVEREARRRRRREGREKGVNRGCAYLVGGSTHYEGLSSDDELLETNRLKFANDSEKITAKASEVFSSVVEDFSKLSCIKQRFESWKFGFPDSYNQAYISLCLPKVFAPFVRLQMLEWNPLEPGCPDFETMLWFQVLMFYGYREGCEPDPEDEDLQLIPRLVETVILPKITVLLQQVWDPLSASHTRRVVGLLKRLTEDYPTVSTENKATQALLTAAITRLRLAVDNDVFIPLFSVVQLANPGSQQHCFFQRQFWSCVKLVGNLTSWEGLLPPDTLQELVLDSLLNRYLLLSLQNSPPSLLSLTKAQAVVFQLPVSWFSDGTVVTRPLQGLTRYLVHLAELLHRSSISSPDTQRGQTKLSLKNIAQLLAKIGARSEALAVANEHKLDDILKSLKL